MKARSVARELALFVLFQIEKKGNALQWEKSSLEELIVTTVRSLSAMAEEQIEGITREICDLQNFVFDKELEHPDNESIPVDLPTRAVPIPTTREMCEKLSSLLAAVNQLQEALYVPEIKALAEREDVSNYTRMLVRNVTNHQTEIDERVGEASQDWSADRIHKMDMMLLRLAVAELMFNTDVQPAVVVDEYLELAKRFTSDESRKFIHGILGQISAQVPAEVTENV
jgi:N utilization substance protein B